MNNSKRYSDLNCKNRSLCTKEKISKFGVIRGGYYPSNFQNLEIPTSTGIYKQKRLNRILFCVRKTRIHTHVAKKDSDSLNALSETSNSLPR